MIKNLAPGDVRPLDFLQKQFSPVAEENSGYNCLVVDDIKG